MREDQDRLIPPRLRRPSRNPALINLPRWNSLSFRLSLAINLTVTLVMLAFWGWDYLRERRVHLDEQADRLREDARVLSVAERRLRGTETFEAYVDAYCLQMDEQISPGHHIALADSSGRILARAHARMDADLEAKMVSAGNGQGESFQHAGQDYLSVRVPVSENNIILVAQSLAPVERVIHRQAVSRAVSVAVLLATVVGITNVLLARWVRRPIYDLVRGVEAVHDGRFEHRVAELGTADLQYLADGFNRMNAALGAAQKRRRQEMEKARRIHLGLLPSAVTAVPGLHWNARYIPADAVGGDYYDLVEYPDGRWLLLIADISGHGVSAALATAMIKALVRQCVRQGCTLPEMMSILNREFDVLPEGEHFVTCLAVCYAPSSGELEYVNCGHEAGVVLTASGECRAKLESTGLPIGVQRDAGWEFGQACLHPGESVCLVTDGVAEACDSQGHMLGRERALHLLQTTVDPDPSRHVDALIKRVRAFSGDGSFSDDLTLVILRRHHSAV